MVSACSCSWKFEMRDKLRLEGLTLTVESVAKSVEFYGGALGLEVAHHWEPAFAMIRVGGELGGSIGPISINEARKEAAEVMTPTHKRAIHIEFPTDDLDALFEELTARGVTFHERPTMSRGSE